jgi:hypothetical protein
VSETVGSLSGRRRQQLVEGEPMDKPNRADAVEEYRSWELVSYLNLLFRTFTACFIAVFVVFGFHQPDYMTLEKQGNEIRVQLEDYHRIHGTYPQEPEAAGIELPVTRFGKWHYEAVELKTGAVDGPVTFRLKLSTKCRPRGLLDPYFTLSWAEWSGWKISTDPC